MCTDRCAGLVAAPVLTPVSKYGWPIAAVIAAALLVFLALQGTDRATRLEQFEATGTMRSVPLESVTTVLIETGTKRWRLVRGGADGTWTVEPALSNTSAADLATKMKAALTLLRNTAPERQFDSAPVQFGLESPQIRLQIQSNAAGSSAARDFRIAFGAVNPIGLANYARIDSDGQSSIVLLSTYVAQAWQALVDLP